MWYIYVLWTGTAFLAADGSIDVDDVMNGDSYSDINHDIRESIDSDSELQTN